MNEIWIGRLKAMDQYEILRELGRGGTSVVYLVRDRQEGLLYALKILRKDDSDQTPEALSQASEQLRAEAAVLRALGREHRGIPAFGKEISGEDGIFAGFLMEYVEGRSLQQLLESGQIYSVREAAEAGLQLCGIMEQLHRMKPPMIYRDLKPANILLRPDGTMVVVDYGSVRKYRNGAGRDTNRLGTEGYAAPEQYGGWEQSDERTDIYGIGAVLHHMVTGRTPLETGLRPLQEIPGPSGSGRIPRQYAEMDKILQRCCMTAPGMRFSNCAELEKSLRGVIRTCARAEAAKARNRDKIWKKFVLLAYAAAVFFTCAGVSAVSSAWAGRMEYLRIVNEAENARSFDEKTEGYRRAVRAGPGDTEAYERFLREITEDYVITQEEKEALDSLLYTGGSLDRMREKHTGEYAKLELEIGKALFSCYQGGTEAARAAFGNALQPGGLWFRDRETAQEMYLVLGEKWTADRIEAWKMLEQSSAAEAHRTGNGIFAAAVCKAAVGEVTLFSDRYEDAGADPETIREVMEGAAGLLDEAQKGRMLVPEDILEELRAAVETGKMEKQKESEKEKTERTQIGEAD